MKGLVWFDKKIIIAFFFMIMNYISISQLDWRPWSSVQLNYKAESKLTIKLEPIWRQKMIFRSITIHQLI